MEESQTNLEESEHPETGALLEQLASLAGCGAGVLQYAAGARRKPPGPTGERGPWEPDLRYRSLIEKLPAVTFMVSLDERVQELYVSPQIESLLGYTQQE